MINREEEDRLIHMHQKKIEEELHRNMERQSREHDMRMRELEEYERYLMLKEEDMNLGDIKVDVLNEDEYRKLLKELEEDIAKVGKTLSKINEFQIKANLMGEEIEINTPTFNISVDIGIGNK